MSVLEVNLVVEDLDQSRAFYAGLGCSFRPISLSDAEEVQAWIAVDGPLPVSIHRGEFARWWDSTEPTVSPGSTVIDVTVDADACQRMLAAAADHGGEIVQPLRDMPWGQAYAILTDPDGYRWGIKTDLPG